MRSAIVRRFNFEAFSFGSLWGFCISKLFKKSKTKRVEAASFNSHICRDLGLIEQCDRQTNYQQYL